MIVVDTSVWSRALRRTNGATDPAAVVLRDLVTRHEPVATPGIVYQELTADRDFERLAELVPLVVQWVPDPA